MSLPLLEIKGSWGGGDVGRELVMPGEGTPHPLWMEWGGERGSGEGGFPSMGEGDGGRPGGDWGNR